MLCSPPPCVGRAGATPSWAKATPWKLGVPAPFLTNQIPFRLPGQSL